MNNPATRPDAAERPRRSRLDRSHRSQHTSGRVQRTSSHLACSRQSGTPQREQITKCSRHETLPHTLHAPPGGLTCTEQPHP
ncbi:MAG: hypothetical protein KDA31_07280 [Phycisphaerales bacterium]|nr:hypothetical protein [Phycisphaerales bacterium]